MGSNTSNAFSGSVPGIGSPGGVGFLSPFDLNAVTTAAGQGVQGMTNRYSQLGLGQTGNNLTNGGGNFGAGPTAYQMDVGTAPSLTGGIPGEALATLGDIQSSDLGSTTASAAAAIQGKGQNISGLTSLATGLGSFFGL